MDETEKSVGIIKRAIRKHWKNGGKVVFYTWGTRKVKGKWKSNKNCCALACALDGKTVDGYESEYGAADRIVDHGIRVGDFVSGFDHEYSSPYAGKWEKVGHSVRQWVKANQTKAIKK